MHWRRKWQPTPVFLPGEFQGRGSLDENQVRGEVLDLLWETEKWLSTKSPCSPGFASLSESVGFFKTQALIGYTLGERF